MLVFILSVSDKSTHRTVRQVAASFGAAEFGSATSRSFSLLGVFASCVRPSTPDIFLGLQDPTPKFLLAVATTAVDVRLVQNSHDRQGLQFIWGSWHEGILPHMHDLAAMWR